MPSDEAEAISEAIGELRGQFEYATVPTSDPDMTRYVTIVNGPHRMYPTVLDYYESKDVTDAEIVANDYFEDIATTGLDFDVDGPIPDSVIANTKEIATDLQEENRGEDDGN